MTELDGPMESTVPIGEIEPARSRHMWRRSGVCVIDGLVVTGTWDGVVTGTDSTSHERQWRRSVPDNPVTMESYDGGVAVGQRGSSGTISLLDRADGSQRWSYAAAADVGRPQREDVFYQPYVVALTSDGTRLYAAVRRYERDGQDRQFHSTVLAFEADGTIAWSHESQGSPIGLAIDDDRLAVGYNRRFGHGDGLIVLDADTGTIDWTWDHTIGDQENKSDDSRRVGDVAFADGYLAVTCHGDYRGYLFDSEGNLQWRVDLATPLERDGQTLYAYPNHVERCGETVVFVTGNTYARESRETNARHPDDHTVFGYDRRGQQLWRGNSGGFVHQLATAGSTLFVPSAQNFRVRDAGTHSLRVFDGRSGTVRTVSMDGIVTASATDGRTVAAVEEPISYHDQDETLGSYALHTGTMESLSGTMGDLTGTIEGVAGTEEGHTGTPEGFADE